MYNDHFTFGVGFYPDRQLLAERRQDAIIFAGLTVVGVVTILANITFAIAIMVMP